MHINPLVGYSIILLKLWLLCAAVLVLVIPFSLVVVLLLRAAIYRVSMDDHSKRFIEKFHGKAGEDFNLWAARAEAALNAKDVGDMLSFDALASDDVDDDTRKSCATACAVLIQGLGDKPLRLCLPEKSNPYRMWNKLQERYAVSNTATRVQLQARLARMMYINQPMGDYVDGFEEVYNRLDGMQSTISDEMQIAMFLASFGDLNKSSFGYIISSLQVMQENLSWETVTARLLQAYDDSLFQSGKSKKPTGDDHTALVVRKNWQRKGTGNKFVERRKCYQCHQKGHLARDCPTRDDGSNVNHAHRDNRIRNSAHKAVLLVAQANRKPIPVRSGSAFVRNRVMQRPQNTYADILLDSGASDHMVRNLSWLRDTVDISPRDIVLGDDRRVRSIVSGSLHLRAAVSGKGSRYRTIVLSNVLFVPDLNVNLLSISKLCDRGCNVKFKKNSCEGLIDDDVVFYGSGKDGVFKINATPIPRVITVANRTQVVSQTLNIWHRRLGHAGIDQVRNLWQSDAVVGMDLSKEVETKEKCEDCMMGKHAKSTLRTNNSRTHSRGAIVHSDLCGPMSCMSFSKSRYFVTFIDEYSRFVTVYPLHRKSDLEKLFPTFMAWFERRFHCVIRRLHSDGGGEYVGMKSLLEEKGIEHYKTPPHSPNQNPIAERMNRTLVESARSMMESSSLPRVFWAEAITHAAHIRNLFPLRHLENRSPYEVMYGFKPRVSHLKIFGCLAWRHIPKENRDKLDVKSERGIIIACYENSQYKLWIPGRRVAVLSRDVVIDETKFPGTRHYVSDIEERHLLDATDRVPQQPSTTPPQEEHLPQLKETTGSNTYNVHDNSSVGHVEESQSLNRDEKERITHYPMSPEQEIPSVTTTPPVNEEQVTRRYPQRKRTPRTFFHPGKANSTVVGDPMSVDSALSGSDKLEWMKAIEAELSSLEKHDVWYSTVLPPGQKLLPTKFIFQKKFDADGALLRYKARLVVQGHLQAAVEMTYSPVVNFTTLRLALALAVQQGMYIHQMDVTTAFLHGEIDGEVYVKPPKGLSCFKDGTVLKLRKGLYGLKQSPRLWSNKWREVMLKLGYRSLNADECVFIRDTIWLLIYVDDIIIISSDITEVRSCKKELALHFDVKDMHELKYFLGIEFIRDEGGAWLSQAGFVKQVLARFDMNNSKPTSTPMVQSGRHEMDNPSQEVLPVSYFQEIVGCLLYIATRTRPDLCAAVGILCRHTCNPLPYHFMQLKRILRYLNGTVDYSLRFSATPGTLHGFSDSDWAGDVKDRKSTTGFILFLGASPISWRTMKQSCTALSTTEAEFVALSETCKETLFLRTLLSDFGADVSSPTRLATDNQGAIFWGKQAIRKAKHVAIRLNFVKQHVEDNAISLYYVPSANMTADVLTKPLPSTLFVKHRIGMSVIDMHEARTSIGNQ